MTNDKLTCPSEPRAYPEPLTQDDTPGKCPTCNRRFRRSRPHAVESPDERLHRIGLETRKRIGRLMRTPMPKKTVYKQ